MCCTGTATLRIQEKFLVYGGFVGVPGDRAIRGVTPHVAVARSSVPTEREDRGKGLAP